MTLDEIITEYSKSCGNAPDDKPWECDECHQAAQRAIQRFGHKGDIKELYLASGKGFAFEHFGHTVTWPSEPTAEMKAAADELLHPANNAEPWRDEPHVIRAPSLPE